MAAKGYGGIIGIRDVYPAVLRADIQKLREGLKYRVKTNPIEVLFVLAVMEVEAWFLSEHSHFGRLDASGILDPIACGWRQVFVPAGGSVEVAQIARAEKSRIFADPWEVSPIRPDALTAASNQSACG